MGFITVGKENSTNIDLYYEDLGSGQPVVLIHGYPLNGHSWERQTKRAARRGLPGDHLRPPRLRPVEPADDRLRLRHLRRGPQRAAEQLELEDIVLVGFSMGTGEVARYLGTYGSDRVEKAAMFGAIPPFLLKTDDNPEGVDGRSSRASRRPISRIATPGSSSSSTTSTTSTSSAPPGSATRPGRRASTSPAWRSANATLDCVDNWLTDFREDLPKIDVPTLVVHGTEDRILPFEATAARLPDLIDDVRVVPVEGGPHNIGWTHPEVLNPLFLAFVESGLEGVDQAQSEVANA